MLDFSYYNPTRLIFGRGSETKVAASGRLQATPAACFWSTAAEVPFVQV